VVVDADDRMLVLDGDRTRVKVFDYRGEFLSYLQLPGLEPEKKPSITALAIDDNGDLYVGDSASGQVIAYDRNLRPKLRIGSYGEAPGQFNGIAGIAFDAKSIYVVSQEGYAIQVFSRQGRRLRSWGIHESGLENVSLPAGVAVDSRGRVILVDTLRQEIKYFDGEGRLMEILGGMGREPGQVSYPSGISIDRKGRLCIADSGNRRVQVLVPVNTPPDPRRP
jgi:hypothetical protein